MTPIHVVGLVFVGWLIGWIGGYLTGERHGIKDTERRWSAAVSRGEDARRADAAAAAQLREIENTLARRLALENFPTSADKVRYLISVAQRDDPRGDVARAAAAVLNEARRKREAEKQSLNQ